VTNQNEQGADEFGANEWLVEELYEKYVVDKNLVDATWWPTLEKYSQQQGFSAPAVSPTSASEAPAATTAPATEAGAPLTGAQPTVAMTTSLPPKAAPIPADAPVLAEKAASAEPAGEDVVTILKGMPKTLAANMDASLTVPTATSVRAIPAKLLIDNRIVINNHLSRRRGGKVSFTHIIGWALVRALKDFPSQNVFYDEVDGKPAMVAPAHVTLGLAVDVPKPDGSRALLVPGIKRADTMTFDEFLAAYEELVAKARNNKLAAEDFQGITMSLTNPGGIGTVHSVPRLMKGQGCIIGAGALDYPAEFQGASEQTLIDMAVSKVLTLTSTYDHRVIQGAGSGEFLKIVHELLIGERNFYEEIFAALRIPYKPIRWSSDISTDKRGGAITKSARVIELINSYRVRGHLMADIDPLEYVQRTHPDLEIESHGLTFWDLDRSFVTGGIGGTKTAPLRKILGILRDSYCRTIGLEYMHIQDPEQRRWIQEKVEIPYEKPGHDDQMRILEKLNEAEAFETFLQTKYVGQKRFSLEGSESLIPLMDALLQEAAHAGMDGVGIGMAHRGRLNALTNVAGKTYGQVFREFEGNFDEKVSRGSGDVKYHLGTEGLFTAPDGTQVPVYLAANPSHLEAVNGVIQGIVRAKQDLKPIGTFTTLPILIHGDAAMAGQGVVYESMQMSQLRAYRIGGTVHIAVNNQVGFTTLPWESRTSVYATDVAKTIQAPIWHVNGDDPEAVVRVARLAFEFRQRFKKDVVIDLVSYRRRGHNEGDDPSMTQPLMYNLIEAKRSVRRLYTEGLVGRGDITQEEFDKAQGDFQTELERAFADTHEAQTSSAGGDGIVTGAATVAEQVWEPESTGVDVSVIHRIGDAFNNIPPGFTVHPKLQQLLTKRVEMSRDGGIDWGFGELLAFGSVLLEGRPVRITGQDVRRGTFVQRHAIFHDRENGQEWLPLTNLSDNQGRFYIYDSLLSEYAVMAFEYGYSVEREDALVLWEAQFGDFADGAQTVIDEYISSSEQKWGQRSGVVLLLPHGYEGQGPDHSSARIERYLQLCAEDNMIVARPSTPANYFHLLRRQTYAQPRKPLIVFTPKAMLRLRDASSPVEEFTTGKFQEVIDDPRAIDHGSVKRVILTAGKPYHDLAAELAKAPNDAIALVRVEQFYPAPVAELNAVLATYPNAELVWYQDEPENQGAWPYMALEVVKYLDGRTIRVVSRAAAASPAAGSAKRHQVEADEILRAALSL